MRCVQTKLWMIVLAAALLAMTMTGFADDTKKQPTPEEMQKMMEIWQKVATPGEQHALIGQMAGNWAFHMKMWMDPKAPPQESDGTSKSEMVFDGRFLHMTTDGMMMGMPFKGMGTLGYDNFRGEYQMTWIDNMGTTTSLMHGKPGSDPKAITLIGKMDEPTTGEKDKDIKYVFKIADDDHHSLEGYDLVGTPQEFKVMEFTYTRQK